MAKKRKLLEVVFDKDISAFAADRWDHLDEALNRLLGQELGWDYGTGYSGIAFLKDGIPFGNLVKGAKVCCFVICEVRFDGRVV